MDLTMKKTPPSDNALQVEQLPRTNLPRVSEATNEALPGVETRELATCNKYNYNPRQRSHFKQQSSTYIYK